MKPKEKSTLEIKKPSALGLKVYLNVKIQRTLGVVYTQINVMKCGNEWVLGKTPYTQVINHKKS